MVQSLDLLTVAGFVEDYLEAVLDEWVLADEGLSVVRPDLRRWEERVDAELEDVLDDCWDDPLKVRAA